jgi:hypothetical protein
MINEQAKSFDELDNSNDAPLTVEVPSEIRAGVRNRVLLEGDCYNGSSCYNQQAQVLAT